MCDLQFCNRIDQETVSHLYADCAKTTNRCADIVSEYKDIELDERGRTLAHLCLILMWSDFSADKLRKNVLWKHNRFSITKKDLYEAGISLSEKEWKWIYDVFHRETSNRGDCRQRTPLHYIALLASHNQHNDRLMNVNKFPYKRVENVTKEQRQLIKSLLKLNYINLEARDISGRTPLHYAALRMPGPPDEKDYYALLQQSGVDVNAKDKYDQTPEQLRRAYIEDVKLKIELEKRTRSREDIIYNLKSLIPKFRLAEKQQILLFEFCNYKADILSAFQFAQVNYIAGNLSQFVNAFASRLMTAMSEKDWRLCGRVMPVGSAHEQTKVAVPNEFDFDVVLTEFTSRVCALSSSPVCPIGYGYLKRNQIGYVDDGFQTFFDDQGHLLTTNLMQAFETTLKSILRTPTFWELEDVFEYDLNYDSDLYSCDAESVCITLRLMVNKPIDNLYIGFPISVDIVPSIHCTWIEDANHIVSDSLKSDGCKLALEQPQKVYPWIPVSIPYARVSFARAGSDIIRGCSAVAKSAFMVTKHLMALSRDSKCTSHVLKIILLRCMASAAREKTKRSSRWTIHYTSVKDTQLKLVSRKLLNILHQFHMQGFVPSYFLPRLCSRVWSRECFLRDFGLQVHSFRSSMKNAPVNFIENSLRELMISERTPNSEPRSLKYVADSFITLNALRWSFCEDEESQPDVLKFLDVANPLVENLYFVSMGIN